MIKEYSDYWLDLVLLKLDNNKMITVEDMDLIIDELMKKRPNLKKVVLKNGYQLTNSDIKKIKSIK